MHSQMQFSAAQGGLGLAGISTEVRTLAGTLETLLVHVLVCVQTSRGLSSSFDKESQCQ